MKFYFINQNNSIPLKRIFHFRVSNWHSSCQIPEHCKSTFFAIGKLINAVFCFVFCYSHSKRISLYFQICKSVKHCLDSFSYTFKRFVFVIQITFFFYKFSFIVFLISEPFKKRSVIKFVFCCSFKCCPLWKYMLVSYS